MEIADRNPLCLDEPAPRFVFQNFGDSALEFLFAVWFEKSDLLVLKTSLMEQIKKRFDEEGIEIPFPHRSLYTGSVTEPFPIRLVAGAEALAAAVGGSAAPPAGSAPLADGRNHAAES